MQPSFTSNMTQDEKQNGCDKKTKRVRTIGSKMGRKFEQERKAKMGQKKQIWSRPRWYPYSECCSVYSAIAKPTL